MSERFCFHWVNGSFHGKSSVNRNSKKDVDVVIFGKSYSLEIDVRDQRTLICFDGGILSGGLPRGATIVHVESNPILQRDIERVYKQRCEYEDLPLYTVTVSGKYAEQQTSRYFILLKSGRAVFRIFKNDTLQPRYLIVDVEKSLVQFSTTSA